MPPDKYRTCVPRLAMTFPADRPLVSPRAECSGKLEPLPAMLCLSGVHLQLSYGFQRPIIISVPRQVLPTCARCWPHLHRGR